MQKQQDLIGCESESEGEVWAAFCVSTLVDRLDIEVGVDLRIVWSSSWFRLWRWGGWRAQKDENDSISVESRRINLSH